MRLKQIRKGVFMKGENELRLSQDAMREAIESFWNKEVAVMHEQHKIIVDWIEYDSKSKKFKILFHQKPQQRT